MPERRLGVDIGGTSVKLGALGAEGEVLGERSVPVAGVAEVAAVLDGIAAAVRDLAPGSLEGLGVGMPGLIDRERGAVEESPNLPIFNRCPLAAELGRRLDLDPARVRLENDANVAALGEARLGAARGAANALVVTLGTGVGGGLLLDGQLVVGEGLAGEIGHVTVDPGGAACGCGSVGCLETLASATAARRRALEAGLPAGAPGDLERLAEAARGAPGPERDLLGAIGRDLGHGLAAALCLVDVRLFVFGGGFAAALDTLEDGLRLGLAEWAYGSRVEEVQLLPAALGPAAGWIGAAHLTPTA